MLARAGQDERQPGATFAPGDIIWIDFETRSSLPIEVGTDRYASEADAIVLAWAIGASPVQVSYVSDFPSTLFWGDMPRALRDAFGQVTQGKMIFCAHNATFDRAIWNQSTVGFPTMLPKMMIDTRVQATASGLPPALEHAAKFSGAKNLKDSGGKDLIKLFSDAGKTATPRTNPQQWEDFLDYAAADIEAMRDLFSYTRQLPLAEWKEYWAAEAINDGGVMIDVPMVTAASKMASEDRIASAGELTRLTEGAVTTVDQVKRMIDWLNDVLPADGREILTKRAEEINIETGEVFKPRKDALDRERVIKLLAYLHAMESLPAPLQAAERVLQIRLYGGSKTPAKFTRMMSSHVGGVIRHQYVFNGAAQTGRFSARGIQVHNLARDPLPYELDAIDSLVAGADLRTFARVGDDTPVSRKLSLLIRPSLIAAPRRAFVWGDWANIEARITPWLADDPEADERLDVFSAVDRGEEKYDIYTRTAATLSGLSLDEAKDPKIRQRGKVVELACGFGGGTNALLNMAASYGMHLPEDEAKAAVDRWREANPWAKRFWTALWDAAIHALVHPRQEFHVGRVSYVFLDSYLRGSLLCKLPSGRCITYRHCRFEMVDETDDDGNVTGMSRELMFNRDMGRLKLWPGLLCENIVQATAADLLRGTLRRLEEYPGLSDWMPTVLHTHDEIVTETKENRTSEAAALLRQFMTNGFDWTAGLPIAADTSVARFYTKSKSSIGL